jgi:hypothetical protein
MLSVSQKAARTFVYRRVVSIPAHISTSTSPQIEKAFPATEKASIDRTAKLRAVREVELSLKGQGRL